MKLRLWGGGHRLLRVTKKLPEPLQQACLHRGEPSRPGKPSIWQHPGNQPSVRHTGSTEIKLHLFFFRFYLFIFRKRRRERVTEEEKHQSVAYRTPLTEDLVRDPDLELNRRPFGSQTSTQFTEPHQPGEDKAAFRKIYSPGPQLGAWERQLINVSLTHGCLSPSLSPSLPLSLKINKSKKKIITKKICIFIH